MVICSSCGEENRDKALFCRKCGEKLHRSMYIKRSEPWGVVHIGVLLLSVLLLITSFGLIMGGTSLRSIQEILTDEEGFIMSKTRRLQVSSYGIVVGDMDFDIDPIAWRWFETRGGFLRFKIISKSNNPEKKIFIGVARVQDAFHYIEPIKYHELVDLDLGWESYEPNTSQTRFILHQGDPPGVPPTVHSFWIEHGAATDNLTLTWEPEAGNYYLVMMNADGSAIIDADVKIGVQIPFFGGLGNVLVIAGIIVGGFGVIMLYLTIRRNQP
jgi:hypothetical protein